MSLAPSTPFNSRILVDYNYNTSASVPSTQPVDPTSASVAASGSLTALDLIQATPYPTTEVINFKVFQTALTGVTGSALAYTYTLQDSANNVTFADIPTLAPMSGAVVSGTTSAATSAVYKVPPVCRRYVRVSALAPVGITGVNGVTGSYGLTLLF